MQEIIDHYYTKKVRKKLLLIQFLLLFVPIITFFSIQTDNGPIPASLCYFFSVVFIPYLLIYLKQIKLPPWYITALCGYVFILAIFRIPQYGLSKSILHWVFGFYLLVVILNAGTDFSLEEWKSLLEAGFCAFAVAHFIFMLWHWETIRWLLGVCFHGLDNAAGVCLPSLTRGGRNLDCSWMGLGAFFVRGKKKSVYVTYAILFSFLGGSRVGVIAVGMAVLWSLFYDPFYRLTLKRMKWYVLYAMVMLFVLFCSGMAQALLSRFMIHIPPPSNWIVYNSIFDSTSVSNGRVTFEIPEKVISIGGDPVYALSGRAAIWEFVPQMFVANPFGYGVGNAMRVMKSDYGFSSYEDVVHNIFLQWLMDEGLIGGLWYLGLVITLFVSQWRYRPHLFEEPFAAYFLTYIVLSIVQFYGAEALMIFVFGIYLIALNCHCICIWKSGKKIRR